VSDGSPIPFVRNTGVREIDRSYPGYSEPSAPSPVLSSCVAAERDHPLAKLLFGQLGIAFGFGKAAVEVVQIVGFQVEDCRKDGAIWVGRTMNEGLALPFIAICTNKKKFI
jgi:hypothetical protein